ncbi:MAG: PatB family C-S lyase [Bacteroidales bacterium]|nr:PatB family C-S lyase [Bacteroidales bacterium]
METKDFNFDQIVPRKGTGCVKWDAQPPFGVSGEDIIPLWVADMDFQAAPCIRKAMQKRMDHGVFGYTAVPESWYAAVCNWFASRHGWNFQKEDIIYTTGVVPAISAVIKALCRPEEKVVVLTPVYNCFFSSIRNNGCKVSESPLKVCDGPRYEIDFQDLEAKLADKDAKLLLFCNPHNPAGRVWTRGELERVADLARKHGVVVVSDEIHCEIVRPGYNYTPFGTVDSGNCISLCSPSKSFNIAGLQMAAIITPNEEWRRLTDRAININEVCDVNPFAPVAGEAAYSREGARWLDAMNGYIDGNYRFLCERFRASAPQFPVFQMEGTYLVWVDCSAAGIDSDRLEELLLRQNRVWVNSGTMYGVPGFIRINIATSRRLLSEGLDRLFEGLESITSKNSEH